MKKLTLALVALLFSVGTSFAQDVNYMEKGTEKYNAAAEKLKTGDFAAAIPLLKEALVLFADAGDEGMESVKDIQSRIPKIHLSLGVQAAKTKSYEEAIKQFLLAEESADLYNDTNTRRAASRYISTVYMAQGADSFNAKEYDKALEIFEKGYKQDSTNVQLTSYTAKTYAELGRIEDAARLFNQVIQTGQANSRYEKEAAVAQTDLEAAVLFAISTAIEASDLEKAATLADLIPSNPQAALIVVQAANNAKKYDLVIDRGETPSSLQTDADLKSEAYHLLGIAYQNKDNKAKAIEYFSKVTSGPFASAAKGFVVELKK